MNRPLATLLLALVAALSFLSNLAITLQFLGVIPWGDEALDFWGGKWAGVFIFGLATLISALVAFGWLTLKPWSLTITALMALLGFSNPLMALMAGTETLSTALLPLILNGAVIYLALRKDVRQAVGLSE